MSHHRNAKLGLAGRYALVCAIEEGIIEPKPAAVAGVDETEDSCPAERRALPGLADR